MMQNYLRIIEKSSKSNNHVSLTTQLEGSPTSKRILVVTAPTSVGPVPVCAAFYSLNPEVENIHKDQQDEMEVDANRDVDDPLEQVKTEQVEASNDPILDSGNSKVAVEENSSVTHVDINKTRINLNYNADLVSVFQSDPHMISAVSVFKENVDRIETPQQLVAFLTNFVASLTKI
jgi:hypothetical protein